MLSPDKQSKSSPEPVKILVFSASLRKTSLNTQLAKLAAQTIERYGGIVDLADMADFDVPSFDQDEEESIGFPPGAEELRRRLEASDAFVIASPEYNASMPGMLKNALDWVSRYRPQPLKEKHALLLSASPSMVGGNRGLWALRVPLEHLGVRVFPEMFSLAQAHKAFTQNGTLVNAELADRFDKTIKGFIGLAEADKHYACIKAAWYEFLGEQPEPATARVE